MNGNPYRKINIWSIQNFKLKTPAYTSHYWPILFDKKHMSQTYVSDFSLDLYNPVTHHLFQIFIGLYDDEFFGLDVIKFVSHLDFS